MMISEAKQANVNKGKNIYFLPYLPNYTNIFELKENLYAHKPTPAVVKIQSIARQFLDKVRYRILRFQCLQKALLAKQTNAVVHIQSHIRGFILRLLQRQRAGARQIIRRTFLRFLLNRYVFLISLCQTFCSKSNPLS